MNNVWTERAKRKFATYPNYQELSWTDYVLIKQGTKSVKVRLYQQTAFRLTLLRWLFHHIYVSEYRLKVTYLHLKLCSKSCNCQTYLKPQWLAHEVYQKMPHICSFKVTYLKMCYCVLRLFTEKIAPEKDFFFQNYITNVVKIDEMCQELSTSHFDASTKTGNCLFVTFC